jgi:uncharacterized protein with GYD domain
MNKYVLFFSYTAEAWAKMIKNPSDRAAAARSAVQTAGGSLESLYFLFGERDGMAIYEAPDAEAAAAVSIAVGSSGAFRALQTSQLLEPQQLISVLGKAGEIAGTYSAPGS